MAAPQGPTTTGARSRGTERRVPGGPLTIFSTIDGNRQGRSDLVSV